MERASPLQRQNGQFSAMSSFPLNLKAVWLWWAPMVLARRHSCGGLKVRSGPKKAARRVVTQNSKWHMFHSITWRGLKITSLRHVWNIFDQCYLTSSQEVI